MSYTNSQCCHVWAQQTKDKGQNGKGTVFFESKTIYSYGYHFPMAHFLNADTILINSDSYSISTSQQQSDVRQAIGYGTGKELIYVDTQTLKIIAKGGSFSRTDRDRMTQHALDAAKSYCKDATKRRKHSLREQDYDSAVQAINTCIKIIEFFKLKPSTRLTKLRYTIINDTSALQNQFAGDIKREKAAQARLNRKREKQNAIDKTEAIADFRAGKYRGPYSPLRQCPVMLRLKDPDTVETSQGAEFPVEHALKAFKFILACKDNNKLWVKNGQSIRLGHFQIDKITDNGDVVAGCHTVAFAEIERMYKELTV